MRTGLPLSMVLAACSAAWLSFALTSCHGSGNQSNRLNPEIKKQNPECRVRPVNSFADNTVSSAHPHKNIICRDAPDRVDQALSFGRSQD